MNLPVVDLHSDLLSFLIHREDRSIEDSLSRNSFSQMRAGNVKVQTLAVYTSTHPHSVERGAQQIARFQHLLEYYPQQFSPLTKKGAIEHSPIQLIAAFENASAFASETESLSEVFSRLEKIVAALGRLFYITMTWNGENRFGGGVGSSSGLKKDGALLLEWLSDRRIAVDLSHTSDKLAYEIIEYIDKASLNVPLLASHSNFRSVTAMPRNLPDEIARELIRRKGLIGINLFAPFVHKTDPFALVRHIEYGLALGGAETLCFGADFFCDTDFPSIKNQYPDATFFFEEYQNSSCYPFIFSLLEKHLNLSFGALNRMGSVNALRFLNAFIL